MARCDVDQATAEQTGDWLETHVTDFEAADLPGEFDLAVAATLLHWIDPATRPRRSPDRYGWRMPTIFRGRLDAVHHDLLAAEPGYRDRAVGVGIPQSRRGFARSVGLTAASGGLDGAWPLCEQRRSSPPWRLFLVSIRSSPRTGPASWVGATRVSMLSGSVGCNEGCQVSSVKLLDRLGIAKIVVR